MSEMEHEANGRATIREVYALLSESRTDSEKQLIHAEERLMNAIHQSEARVLASIGDLGQRVMALEVWRAEMETSRAVGTAAHEARAFYFRQVMAWLEQHWKLLTLIAMTIAAVFAVIVDVDIHTK